MKKRKHPQQKLSIIASFFVILTVPLAVFAIVNMDSFDTRDQASLLGSYGSKCNINFPYVNPESIEVGKTVQVQIDAKFENEVIRKIDVIDRSGKSIFSENYTDHNFEHVTEIIEYNAKKVGTVDLLGTVETDLGSYPCTLSQGDSVRVLNANDAPVFKTLPSSADPSNDLQVGDSYSYTLIAEDAEDDTINYSYSFTPRADWLKMSVLEDGGDGKLNLRFTGTPDKPASYLANVFIHDGYNAHLSSQSWVISVEQDENDTPKVTFITPNKPMEVDPGTDVKASWEVDDLNLITKYELYVATNPGNENTWIPIDTDLPASTTSYLFDTSTVLPGNYQFIMRATDNYSPPATGVGVSEKVAIGTALDPDGPDDGIQLQEAQILNISPNNGSNVKNTKATISATLVAASGEKVDKGSIEFHLDGVSVMDDVKLSDISDAEISVIYTPEKDYAKGLHKVKVSFQDSANNKAEKEWSFEIVDEDEDSDTFNIFGFEIPKRTAYIIGGGIGILILALVIPWILYLAWRGSGDETYTSNDTTSHLPPTSPISPAGYDSYYDYSSKESDYTPPESLPTSTTVTGDTEAHVVEGLGYTNPSNDPELQADDATVAYDFSTSEPSTSPEPVTTEEETSVTELANQLKELQETEATPQPKPEEEIPVTVVEDNTTETPADTPYSGETTFSAPSPNDGDADLA